MEIVLSYTYDEQSIVFKSLNNQTTITGTLKQECSIINPVIIIEIDNPSAFNYMYIPSFNRYYYITDMVSVRNGLWRISGRVDVLMSFSGELMNTHIAIGDVESGFDSYLISDAWKTTVKNTTDIISFPDGLNDDGEYILITSGGIAS